VEDPHLALQVSAQEVVKVVHLERCNAVASVAALMGQKTVTAIVTALLDLLPAVDVAKASQESVLHQAVGSVQPEWLLFVLEVEAGLKQGVVREGTDHLEEADLVETDLLVAVDLVETDLLVEVDLVETDLLVEEVVQEAIAHLVVAVDLVEIVHLVVDLQEGCLLQCLVERMG